MLLVHLEPDYDHRLSGTRSRVDVFDARHFPKQLLYRTSDPLFNICRCRPRHLDEHVNHRHDDLRFLFARQRQHREDTKRDRSRDEERRQLRVDERPGDPAGNAMCSSHHRPPTLTRRPSTTSAGGERMTTSDSVTPARTSDSLRFTRRTRATPSSTTNTKVSCPRRTIADDGMVKARRGVPSNRALPNSPDRRAGASGNAILTRNARASASTARLTSTTLPSIEVSFVPRRTGTLSPFRIWPMRDSSTRTSRRNPRVSSRRRRGMPGDAMFPGSTIFSVTMPSKGAAIVVKDS